MSDIQQLNVEIAELRKDIEYLSHDIRNLTQRLEAMPTLRDYNELKERVIKTEANMSKAGWAVITSWLALLGMFIKTILDK